MFNNNAALHQLFSLLRDTPPATEAGPIARASFRNIQPRKPDWCDRALLEMGDLAVRDDHQGPLHHHFARMGEPHTHLAEVEVQLEDMAQLISAPEDLAAGGPLHAAAARIYLLQELDAIAAVSGVTGSMEVDVDTRGNNHPRVPHVVATLRDTRPGIATGATYGIEETYVFAYEEGQVQVHGLVERDAKHQVDGNRWAFKSKLLPYASELPYLQEKLREMPGYTGGQPSQFLTRLEKLDAERKAALTTAPVPPAQPVFD